MNQKDQRRLETIFKGVANHRRIAMIVLLHKQPELSVMEIADAVKADYPTVSEHLRKLMLAGLVMKRSDGNSVRHRLTNRGTSILSLCRTLV